MDLTTLLHITLISASEDAAWLALRGRVVRLEVHPSGLVTGHSEDLYYLGRVNTFVIRGLQPGIERKYNHDYAFDFSGAS